MQCSRVAIRVGRGVAALEMNLMGALLECREEAFVQAQATLGLGMNRGRPAFDPVGVELLVPTRVQRVGEIGALPVAAELHHLRAAVQRSALGMRCLADNATEVDAAGLLGLEGIADIELMKLAGTQRRHVESAIVEGEDDVAKQRRYVRAAI